MKPSSLEWDIYKTLAYFSHHRYPLTVHQIWQWLYRPRKSWTYGQIMQTLDRSVWLQERVCREDGMYGLCNDQEFATWVADRHAGYVDAILKERKLRGWMRYLKRIPSIEGIAICNTLAWQKTREQSDIDLFIITKPGMTWQARLLSVAPMIALRQRPGEVKIHAIDASFFVSSDTMNLEACKIQSQDPYLAMWIQSLQPVHGSQELWQRFWQENAWAGEVFPHAPQAERARFFRHASARTWPWLRLPEAWAKKIQWRRFPQDIHHMMNRGDQRVIVRDDMLKFHKNDRREAIAVAFEQKIAI